MQRARNDASRKLPPRLGDWSGPRKMKRGYSPGKRAGAPFGVQKRRDVKKAFVAGATGYTGRSVVSELRAAGVQTWAHVRPDSSRLGEWRARFEAIGAVVDTTPWEERAFKARLAELRPDLVFALLGTTRARARAAAADASYEAIDYGLTALLLRATHGGAPHARFVYLSAIGVSGPSRNPYMDVRWRIEQEVLRSGIEYVITRPSFITGADRDEHRPGERAAALVVNGALQMLGAIGL